MFSTASNVFDLNDHGSRLVCSGDVFSEPPPVSVRSSNTDTARTNGRVFCAQDNALRFLRGIDLRSDYSVRSRIQRSLDRRVLMIRDSYEGGYHALHDRQQAYEGVGRHRTMLGVQKTQSKPERETRSAISIDGVERIVPN